MSASPVTGPTTSEPDLSALDQFKKSLTHSAPMEVEERDACLRRAQDGGSQAMDRLVQSYQRMVFGEARRYAGHGVPVMDLVQEGNLGLLRAVEKYRWDQGASFTTYARHWWVRRYIVAALAKHSHQVRLSRREQDILLRMTQAREELDRDGDDPPTARHLARVMDEPVDVIRRLLALGDGTRLDTPLPQEKETEPDTAQELVLEEADQEIHQHLEALDRRAGLDEVMEKFLTAQSREIVVLYYGLGDREPMTQAEIGMEVGYSQRHISTLLQRATEVLRGWSDQFAEF